MELNKKLRYAFILIIAIAIAWKWNIIFFCVFCIFLLFANWIWKNFWKDFRVFFELMLEKF